LAGKVIGVSLNRLDWVAWFVFGLAFLLAGGLRWLEKIEDPGLSIGPLRLWIASALAALLMCLTSSMIVTPRLRELRTSVEVPMEALAADHPLHVAFDRAHAISRQLLGLRILLALGLAAGIAYLPKEKEADPDGANGTKGA